MAKDNKINEFILGDPVKNNNIDALGEEGDKLYPIGSLKGLNFHDDTWASGSITYKNKGTPGKQGRYASESTKKILYDLGQSSKDLGFTPNIYGVYAPRGTAHGSHGTGNKFDVSTSEITSTQKNTLLDKLQADSRVQKINYSGSDAFYYDKKSKTYKIQKDYQKYTKLRYLEKHGDHFDVKVVSKAQQEKAKAKSNTTKGKSTGKAAPVSQSKSQTGLSSAEMRAQFNAKNKMGMNSDEFRDKMGANNYKKVNNTPGVRIGNLENFLENRPIDTTGEMIYNPGKTSNSGNTANSMYTPTPMEILLPQPASASPAYSPPPPQPKKRGFWGRLFDALFGGGNSGPNGMDATCLSTVISE